MKFSLKNEQLFTLNFLTMQMLYKNGKHLLITKSLSQLIKNFKQSLFFRWT